VTVQITDNTAVVYVSVILKYGYSIPEVSQKIQERITNSIETMTGLTVAEVNVKIAGVKVENK
ncbi:MAG: Asp23/Gls24 family envelope stress response protein, partial [Lachnospiraceae bacterium]